MRETISRIMQEAMDDYNRKVKAAMNGDEEAQAYLISCERGDTIKIDCTKEQYCPITHRHAIKRYQLAEKNGYELSEEEGCGKCPYRKYCEEGHVYFPKRWKTFREWAAWNRDKGTNIRRMIQSVK